MKLPCIKTGLCLVTLWETSTGGDSAISEQLATALPACCSPIEECKPQNPNSFRNFESSCKNRSSKGKKLLKQNLTLLCDLQSAAKSIFLPVWLLGKPGSFSTACFTPRTNGGGMFPLSHQYSISCGLQHAYRSLPADKLCVTWGSDSPSSGHRKSWKHISFFNPILHKIITIKFHIRIRIESRPPLYHKVSLCSQQVICYLVQFSKPQLNTQSTHQGIASLQELQSAKHGPSSFLRAQQSKLFL